MTTVRASVAACLSGAVVAAWDDTGTVNVLDIALLALLGLGGYSGYRRGLALQASAFAGLLLGLFVGVLLAPRLAAFAESPGTQAAVAATTLIALAAAGDAAGWFVGHRARERARATRFNRADAIGGSVVAVAASLLVVWFVALNLVNGPFPAVSHEIRGSAIVRTLDDAFPEPPSLLAEVRQLFNRFGFPDVFSGIPPLPASPVDPPTEREAQAAFAAASGSTVKVYGEACDHVQEGSGFVAATALVVTNAHVLAGVDDPLVQTTTGAAQRATTVLFDPELDLAVLRVAQTPGAVLELATTDSTRGDAGAVIGFPGGGPLDARRAAVLRLLENVVGRDIYGEDEAERSVLELQAVVRPGNSGGPFVLADGTVAGVVFAASSTDEGIGYAITADEVQPRLDDAIRATTEVATGPCVS
ncbi:MAG: MarP family serine protease [Actinomycetota bacterium]